MHTRAYYSVPAMRVAEHFALSLPLKLRGAASECAEGHTYHSDVRFVQPSLGSCIALVCTVPKYIGPLHTD